MTRGAGNPGSRQLVARALRGEAAARVPVGPLAVHCCARLAGVSIRQYTTDAVVLADSVARYYERFRPDAVWISADTWVTAEAMGAAVTFPGDDQPLCGAGEPLVRVPRDVDRIPPPRPERQGRMPLMLDALDRVRALLGGKATVVGCFDQYPFSAACALMGIDRLMLKLADDRPMVEALMERCLEYGIAYATAMAAAGADVLSGGDSPAGLIGPARYREVARPFEQRLVASVKTATEKPVSLHICGDATALLADMAATGADILELDHQVDMAAAARTVGPGVALWGNLDPVGLLARGSPEEVGRAARRLTDEMKAEGHRRFVLSSGCTLVVDTPAENIAALVSAPRAYC